jgi:hypothetical protein
MSYLLLVPAQAKLVRPREQKNGHYRQASYFDSRLWTQGPDTNGHAITGPLRYQDERWRNVGIEAQHCLDCGHGELRVNMAGPEIDDPDERLVLKDRQLSEISVVADDNPSLRFRQLQQVHVCGALQARLHNASTSNPSWRRWATTSGSRFSSVNRGKSRSFNCPPRW